MTREEKIEILEKEKAYMLAHGGDRQAEALTSAIKALQQDTCEDSISRQAALDCFTATKLKKFDFILYAREEIKNLPPVNPQPKGHWINNQNGTYTCDKCGGKHSRSNYCPNCGAKMVERQESEDKE